MLLKRFWFKFNTSSHLPPGALMGCGVTAFNLEDAKKILTEKVFMLSPFSVAEVIEDINICELDKHHVQPNMGMPHQRGVWFPLGYS
jgi:hypothetical protein